MVANHLLLPKMQVKEELVFAPPLEGQSVRLANVSISTLSLLVDYSFDLHVHWPESRLNMGGEKAVGIVLENRLGMVLYHQRRTMMLRYKSYLRLLMERIFYAVPLVLNLVQEHQYTMVNLVRGWTNNGAQMIRVELDAKAHIYSAE